MHEDVNIDANIYDLWQTHDFLPRFVNIQFTPKLLNMKKISDFAHQSWMMTTNGHASRNTDILRLGVPSRFKIEANNCNWVSTYHKSWIKDATMNILVIGTVRLSSLVTSRLEVLSHIFCRNRKNGFKFAIKIRGFYCFWWGGFILCCFIMHLNSRCCNQYCAQKIKLFSKFSY